MRGYGCEVGHHARTEYQSIYVSYFSGAMMTVEQYSLVTYADS